MTYPTSSPVSAGQPTASSHYNTLRADALYLGQLERDSTSLGALLQRYESGLCLEYLAVNRLRVPASAAAPVSLAVNGCMLQAAENIDLPGGAAPTGPAAVWYVFAVQSAGSSSFTIDCNTSPGESSSRRRIGSFYWDGSTIQRGSIRTEAGDALRSLLPYADPLTCQGRLTLASGSPVPPADVSAAGTLYFSPYRGSQVSLYTPLGWRLRSFSEVSLSLSSLASSTNYDVFLYDLDGALTLQAAAWTADTTRAAALAWQDGVPVQTGAPERRYLGTIRTSAAGQGEDSALRRFVWNFTNRRVRSLRVAEQADLWTYNVRTLRPFNNSTANRVEFVLGLLEDAVQLNFCAFAKAASAANFGIGIGLDSITADDPLVVKNAGGSTTGDGLSAVYSGLPGQVGYHYLQLLEIAASAVTTTYYGNRDLELEQSGASGFVMA